MEEFIRQAKCILTPTEANQLLAYNYLSNQYLTVLKIIYEELNTYSVSINPHKYHLVINPYHNIFNIFPLSNSEITSCLSAYSFSGTPIKRLLTQYKAYLYLWQQTSSITPTVQDFISTNRPAQFILDLTKLNF